MLERRHRKKNNLYMDLSVALLNRVLNNTFVVHVNCIKVDKNTQKLSSVFHEFIETNANTYHTCFFKWLNA